MYKKYVSSYYDNCHVESYNLGFKIIVKQLLDELEHNALITEWKSIVEKYSRKKQAKEKNKSIVTLSGTTGHTVLNKSFCGYYFNIFFSFTA